MSTRGQKQKLPQQQQQQQQCRFSARSSVKRTGNSNNSINMERPRRRHQQRQQESSYSSGSKRPIMRPTNHARHVVPALARTAATATPPQTTMPPREAQECDDPRPPRNKQGQECDVQRTTGHRRRRPLMLGCHDHSLATLIRVATAAAATLVVILQLLAAQQLMLVAASSSSSTPVNSSSSGSIIIDQQSFPSAQLLPTNSNHQQHGQQGQHGQQQQPQHHHHLQPSFVYGARNRSINFTHVAVDELTGSIYVGATNWLFQLSAANLKAEFALKTGPALDNSRDCAPADCLAHIAHVDTGSLPMHHAHGPDLSVPSSWSSTLSTHHHQGRRLGAGSTMHTQLPPLALASNASSSSSSGGGGYAFLTPPRSGSLARASSGQVAGAAVVTSTTTTSAQQLHNNNYNKILAIDAESRQLIVCGSLNQGACRRHQLGQLANYSELIPLPVASNDEHSSSVALVSSPPLAFSQQQQQQQRPRPVLYVAATNSRLGPYREMVPAISARYLEPANRAMQIIEKSFTDSARVDISFELRDYYLVNYVHTFQHNDYIYFATVQRKSQLRQLEEWGYITRLARLCLSDLSFQSYTELTLECRSPPPPSSSSTAARFTSGGQQQQQQVGGGGQSSSTNYNLLQDAYLTSASSHLAHQLGVRAQSAVLVGAFSLSKDHTTRSQAKSAVCLYPMERIEQRFSENIHMCYNGTLKARNMNYIAGSVNDCPKPGKAGNIANFCNEPLKLNGSLPLSATPVIVYDNELITSIAATQAPTAPLSPSNVHDQQQRPHPHQRHQQQQQQQQQQHYAAASSHRQHQVLVAGTNEGALKRIVLVPGEHGFGLRGVEFDSVQVDEQQQEPILADLHLMPANNPQLGAEMVSASAQSWPAAEPAAGNAGVDGSAAQFAIVATPYKLAKLRVNACKAARSSPRSSAAAATNNSTSADECQACAQLQDPFCGWCATAGACMARDECAMAAAAATGGGAHWSPFNQIRCADYQPLAPQFVALQTSGHQPIDVNVRLQQRPAAQLALQLAQAQFTCHFDYLALANRSAPAPRLSGATTKATQARLNLHTSTVVIACPLPPPAQRPHRIESPQPQQQGASDQLRARLNVRLVPSQQQQQQQQQYPQGAAETPNSLQQVLGMTRLASSSSSSLTRLQHSQEPTTTAADELIERELTLYDCSVHSSCRSCLSAGLQATAAGSKRGWSCAWCPLSNRCTFNASHPDFGCAASAIISTTPHSAPSPSSNSVRASHLASSLDQAQASVFGMSVERLAQCPAAEPAGEAAAVLAGDSYADQQQRQLHQKPAKGVPLSAVTSSGAVSNGQAAVEILIPNNARRSIQVPLRQPIGLTVAASGRSVGRAGGPKLECLLELEGTKARFGAKLLEGSQQLVVCQETTFAYLEETATLRAQLVVILNDNQVIEMTDVILYKCHLFGVSPPALTSTVGAAGGGASQHSSAAWRAHELFQLAAAVPSSQQQQQQQAAGSLYRRQAPASYSDCSLCLNVERKYQCAWCQNQCQHSDQCAGAHVQASTCPPPRIDSIHPTNGPLEGGTLLTIQGSNLGSNEREIQDKISVGGEPCQLVMYSVSTRIVCKTGPSLHGPQAATVFVGNRAGVTSAYEKFHYKAVHLTDVSPRIGPVSGGTRLTLTGSNLNIGSRVQIFLDEIPCSLDSNDISSNQIACITAPNLLASSMRITKLTLMIDNSTHYLPYPFTYQPDPIITNIEPAESFVSGGRLIMIAGQNLASPQSTKLMVYHEHKHNIINGTSCITQNDTLITCLTPALSRDMLASLLSPMDSSSAPSSPFSLSSVDQAAGSSSSSSSSSPLSYESGGLKLKISLFMDDVRSVRNLDEYYHHLPHYLTYYDDPQLFRLPSPVVEFADELVIAGENLKMKQLDQDMLITIGSHICPIKTLSAHQVICEPSPRIRPVYDENGQLVERPLLPIVALIGSNLRYQIGHMQYSSRQYQFVAAAESTSSSSSSSSYPIPSTVAGPGGFSSLEPSNSVYTRLLVLALSSLVMVGLFVAGLMKRALLRFRQSKAEREYKRIQLQMGSLDINGQPLGGNGNLFDNIQSNGQTALGKRPFYQLSHQLPSFPPSPLTDISSLTGTQHLVKLSSNGTIINSTSPNAHLAQQRQQQPPPHQSQQHLYHSANSSSSQSSPGSTRTNSGHQPLFSQSQQQQQQQQQQQLHQHNGSSRNFSWTQEAPSTIVPYAVIEACSLTLEGKNAIKEYV